MEEIGIYIGGEWARMVLMRQGNKFELRVQRIINTFPFSAFTSSRKTGRPLSKVYHEGNDFGTLLLSDGLERLLFVNSKL